MAVLMAPRSGCLVVLLVQFMVTAASSLKVADKTHTIPFTYVGSGYGDCTACTECQGDCDRDTQCAGGLVCVHNTMFDAIPGCTDGGGPIPGGMFEGTLDFCAKDPSAASATGDPHLQNIYGERFDLMKEGNVTLIHIPRGVRTESALLVVEADARRFGGQCEDIYFTTLNVTGSWAFAKRPGGYHYVSTSVVREPADWIALGGVELKVVHGRTPTGTQYLNFHIKHLGMAGFAVGGLLGEDDHEDVTAAPASCLRRMSLEKQRARFPALSASLIAEGALA